MRKKTLVAACVASLFLTAGVFFVARHALVRSFENIETDAARQSVTRARKALEADLRQLELSTADYAQWDDTYQFIVERNPAYIESNFTNETLETLHVDVVWMIDNEARRVIGLQAPGEVGRELEPLAGELEQMLRRDLAFIASSEGKPPLSRIVQVQSGAMAFAAVGIRRTDLSGPDRGLLVYGRYLDEAVVAQLEQTTQQPVTLTRLDPRGSTAAAPLHVRNWLASSPAPTASFVRLDDPKSLHGYSLLYDGKERPVVLLSTATARHALEVGKRTILLVIVTLVTGFAAVLAVLLTILNRSWKARVVTERQRRMHQRRLAHLARHDALTGLPNRLYLQSRLPRLIASTERDRSVLALFYVDLDSFKDVNDSLGHGAGDRLLLVIAQRLRSALASHDLVVRMGGDEFVIVTAGLPDVSAAHSIARRIQEALAAAIEIDGTVLRPTLSMGISVFPDDGSNLEQLLKNADIACYQAKERGRANHQFFTPEMDLRLSERLRLEQSLRAAMNTGQLSVEYQPAFDLKTERPVSLEALVRWMHPELGLVPPSRFIPIAEQAGLICEVGEWVLRRVCQQLSDWHTERVPLLPVSVNVSPRQIARGRFAELVAATTREFGIDANLLHFEITESAVMQDSELHLGTLQALRSLGSRILIDDFGTGYSSLSYLKHLPIDTLKIDRAFVRDMATDPNDAAIVRAIIGIASSLGLNLVAEGIETPQQLEALRGLGCQLGQGFYFSRPLTPGECRLLLVREAALRRSGETAKIHMLNLAQERAV